MNKLGGAAFLALTASSASAGGLDLSGQPILPLFEQGIYAELSVASINTDISGTDVSGQPTGKISERFFTYKGALKTDATERLSLAVLWDQPFYGQSKYGAGLFSGLDANLDSQALTFAARYKFNDRYSVYAGPRIQQMKADASFPLFGYSLDTSTETDLGYVVGAAFEIPEYHTLVALTYHSSITHSLEATESGINSGAFDIVWPESYTLDFRAPVSQSTLLFGSIRHTKWDGYDISPPIFSADGSSILALEDDTTTYRLGVAQKFNNTWSGLVRFTYEAASDDEQVIFSPYNGVRGVGLGASYQRDKLRITAMADYFDLKGTTGPVGDFDGDSAIAVGMQIGYHF
ncbi:hypothetical protein CEK60_21140 [Halomonas sp. N3-2A]|nr:hypothetical protein CEK60_21140 [Halomonas sp. N3-2A]